MAGSIKRVIIILSLINLLIVLIMGFAQNLDQNNVARTEITRNIQSHENRSQTYIENYQDIQQDSQQIQFNNYYGDVRLGQKNIFELMANGIEYTFSDYECVDLTCDNEVQNAIQSGVRWVIIMINVFALIDIFFIIYSRKYD